MVNNLNKNELKKLKEYLLNIKKTDFVIREKLNFPGYLTFGCEVEVDNIDVSEGEKLLTEINKNYDKHALYKVKEDKTVDAEFITPVLHNDKETWIRFNKLLKTLKDNNAKISSRTSGHIHIGTHPINDLNKLQNLIKTLCVFEHIIFKFGYGFKNKPVMFQKCNKFQDRPTYTRIIDPKDAKRFMERTTLDKYNNCYEYHKFIHAETFTRPVFNFRNFNYVKLVGEDINYKFMCNMAERFKYVYPYEDHLEIRCFSGSLDTRIWQNNVDLIERIIFCIENNLLDMDYINYLFDTYKNQSYSFYHNLETYSTNELLPQPSKYNEHLNRYSIPDIKNALWIADNIYNIFKNDQYSKEMFLKQYFKLYNKHDLTLNK